MDHFPATGRIRPRRQRDDADIAHGSPGDRDANRPGNDCVELCMQVGSTMINLDNYCCLDASLIGGADSPDECEYWVP